MYNNISEKYIIIQIRSRSGILVTFLISYNCEITNNWNQREKKKQEPVLNTQTVHTTVKPKIFAEVDGWLTDSQFWSYFCIPESGQRLRCIFASSFQLENAWTKIFSSEKNKPFFKNCPQFSHISNRAKKVESHKLQNIQKYDTIISLPS